MPEVAGLEKAPSAVEGALSDTMAIRWSRLPGARARAAGPSSGSDTPAHGRFESPSPGRVFQPHEEVVLVVAARGVPPGAGYSAMAYFGGGNPFPVELPPDGRSVAINVADLPPRKLLGPAPPRRVHRPRRAVR